MSWQKSIEELRRRERLAEKMGGEEPVERPLSPNDLWATVYRHLGVDHNLAFPDHAGRPMPILPHGSPIEELLPVT